MSRMTVTGTIGAIVDGGPDRVLETFESRRNPGRARRPI